MADNKLSKAQIQEFIESPVWKAVVAKIQFRLNSTDALIENPDPFVHGTAIGARHELRVVLSLPGILLEESEPSTVKTWKKMGVSDAD